MSGRAARTNSTGTVGDTLQVISRPDCLCWGKLSVFASCPDRARNSPVLIILSLLARFNSEDEHPHDVDVGPARNISSVSAPLIGSRQVVHPGYRVGLSDGNTQLPSSTNSISCTHQSCVRCTFGCLALNHRFSEAILAYTFFMLVDVPTCHF